MAADDNCQIWIRTSDRERLAKLAEAEDRTPKLQVKVLLDEACEKRGLDPETCEPVPAPTSRR